MRFAVVLLEAITLPLPGETDKGKEMLYYKTFGHIRSEKIYARTPALLEGFAAAHPGRVDRAGPAELGQGRAGCTQNLWSKRPN